MESKKKQAGRWLVPTGAAFCCILWGLAFPCMEILYDAFSLNGWAAMQILLAGWRFAAAGILLLLYEIARGYPAVRPLWENPQRAAQVAGFGLLQTGVQYALFYLSMNWLPSGRASLINTTNAFLSVLLAHFFCKGDRINRNKILGCALGFCGIVLLCGDIRQTGTLPGDVLMFASALTFSVGNILCQRLSSFFRPVTLAGWQMLFGGCALILTGVGYGAKLHSERAVGWLVMAFLTLQSAVTFALWTVLLTKDHVSSIGIYTCMIPVVGVISSAVLPEEPPLNWRILLSLVLCTSGVVFANFTLKPQRAKTEEH